jgi:tetratricopeptide (TPR) repeat protein
MTQKELAEASRVLPAPIEREFIANLETAGLPGTVRKFLSFAWLTDADPGVVMELSVAGTTGVQAGSPTVQELEKKCRKEHEAGRHDQALALALFGARSAGAEGREELAARMLLIGAISAQSTGKWRLTRELAEQALCSGAVSSADRGRAAIVLAGALGALGRDALALHALRLVDSAMLASDRRLGSSYWHQKAVLEWSSGSPEAAVKDVNRALRYYARTGELAERAKLHCLKALVLTDLDARAKARVEISRAIRDIEGSGDRGASFREVLVDAGAVLVRCGKSKEGRTLLRQALDLSEEASDTPRGFEARLYLYEAACRGGDLDKARELGASIRGMAARVRLDPIQKREYERVMSERASASALLGGARGEAGRA